MRAALLLAATVALLSVAASADNRVEFGITDNPGNWYEIKDGPAIGRQPLDCRGQTRN
jgi:hypothetical protein